MILKSPGFAARLHVGSGHAGGKATRRPRAGFLAFCSSALTCWHSKKQASTEASSFGSELIAMKQAAEHARGLRCKLRMMGARANAPTYTYAGSLHAIASSSVPGSALKKKSSSIASHFAREGPARDEWRIACASAHGSPAGLVAKCLARGVKRAKLASMLARYVKPCWAKTISWLH